ncbi:MAG TPA: very short patch repair endonuclease [Firmicutes bacterium]|jgi:DNA mismatch endonuclease, patch repair protein|nr:very short patch repair endonuclease [Bacillota bacterium]
MDNVSSEVRKRTMQSVKSYNTKLENKVMKALWSKNIRYRKNVNDLVGHPDISIKNKKIVVFIDSCFWHGCPEHCRMPHTNEIYWNKKIGNNKTRDQSVNKYYADKGWTYVRVWEHELRDNFDLTVMKLAEIIKNN